MALPSFVLVTVQFACLAMIAWTGPLVPEGWTGRSLEILAVLLGLWAIAAMNPRKVKIAPSVAAGADLVSRGPYRWIRHPMYAAVLLVSLVPVVTYPSPFRIGVWGLLLLNLIVKLHYEERLLLRHFDGYRAYQRRTKRLLPFLF